MDDLGRLPAKGSQDAQSLEELRIKLDDNGNGELEFDEFVVFLEAYYKSIYERIFKSFAINEAVPMRSIVLCFLFCKITSKTIKTQFRNPKTSNLSKTSQRFQMHPNASERIPAGPNRFEWVRICLKASKTLRTRPKI